MTIKQVTVEGRDYSRKVWFLSGPRETLHPLCVFLDGEFYLEKMGILSIVETAVADGRIPAMSVAIVSHNGAQSRHEDYVCNDRFARYVSEDLLLWAKSENVSIRADKNIICGVSLSGLASAHIHLTFPHIFSSSLSQSGSFWWNRKRFASLVRERSRTTSRYWLSVGNEETQVGESHPPTGMLQEYSQIDGVQSASDALKAAGAEVSQHLYQGGHEFEPWINELPDALEWFVGNDKRI